MPRDIKSLPHHDAPVVDMMTGRMKHEWYARLTDLVGALINRVPLTGSVTFAAATTAAVTFATPEANATYRVWFNSTDAKTYWASSKTTTGFTANASASSSATVDYMITRA